MRFRWFDMVLAATLGVVIALIWVAGRDFSRPNVEFMPDMAHSLAYETFAANPNFRDAKTLQQPPAHSIVRGYMPLHYEATPEDAVRAGNELESPVPLDDPQVLARGAFVYSAFCQQCHGPSGLGDGPVAKRGFPPPPSLMADNARNMKNGQVFHILTYGQGNMPAHAGQLSRRDRWKVAAHVRELQRRTPLATQPATQPASEDDAPVSGDPAP